MDNLVEMALLVTWLVLRDKFRTVLGSHAPCLSHPELIWDGVGGGVPAPAQAEGKERVREGCLGCLTTGEWGAGPELPGPQPSLGPPPRQERERTAAYMRILVRFINPLSLCFLSLKLEDDHRLEST